MSGTLRAKKFIGLPLVALLCVGSLSPAGAALDIDLEGDASIDESNWALTDNGRTVAILNWDGSTPVWNTVDSRRPEITTEQARAGAHSLKFCLLPRVGSSSHRTEYKWLYREHLRWEETRFIGFSVRVPADFPTTSIQRWLIFFQLWSRPTSPPVDFELMNNNGQLYWHLIVRRDDPDPDMSWQFPFPKDQWNDFVIQFRPDYDSPDGLSRVWFNGRKLVDFEGVVGYPANDMTEGKFGWYSGGQNATLVSYYDEVRWGNSFAQVVPGGGAAEAPSVSVTLPAGGAVLPENQPVSIEATATDAEGSIARVDFFVDGELAGQDNTAPYACVGPALSIGTHSICALATDNDGIVNSSQDINVVVQGQPLPAPWQHEDIGQMAIPGMAGVSNQDGRWYVAGGGDRIWDATDVLHFVYQPVEGNCEITARVTSLESAGTFSKAVVLVRESLDENAKLAAVGQALNSHWTFQRRTVTGGQLVSAAVRGEEQQYYRLVRDGDVFRAYRSADGSEWVSIGTITIPMSPTVYVGLGVCDNDAGGSTALASFDNVAVTEVTVAARQPLSSSQRGPVPGISRHAGHFTLNGKAAAMGTWGRNGGVARHGSPRVLVTRTARGTPRKVLVYP